MLVSILRVFGVKSHDRSGSNWVIIIQSFSIWLQTSNAHEIMYLLLLIMEAPTSQQRLLRKLQLVSTLAFFNSLQRRELVFWVLNI